MFDFVDLFFCGALPHAPPPCRNPLTPYWRAEAMFFRTTVEALEWSAETDF